MMLSTGARLGPYEILGPIGAGGMGEVYKARDSRLERTVAVKVLPQHLSSSPEVRQRFEREAKTISQLSHPHICALYDVGREGETEYLVMEYLEGETLSERLVKGPLHLGQTLRYGIEIADALDKAHRQGIVHRDLKPGNVMLTKSGVKLLDFGLAKAMAPAAPKGSVTALPTQAALTQEGTILGTFQYMAPEQLEGREADARTDIFALGCVLYEMATGKRAFTGASQASLIGAILHTDPAPISAIQPTSPPALDRVVKKSLAKDPEDRWQNAADLGSELKWVAEGSQAGAPVPAAVGRAVARGRLGWIVAGALALVLFAGTILVLPRLHGPAVRAAEARFTLEPPPGMTFWDAGADTDFAIAPDGQQFVFVSVNAAGRNQLCLRPLDAIAARPLPGTEGARWPFWSPDGQVIGFFADNRLKKLALAGGSPQVVAEGNYDMRGAAWRPDGYILFGYVRRGLMRVSADGGEPAVALPVDAARKEFSIGWPVFLPDGRSLLYQSLTEETAERGLYVASFDGKKRTRILSSISKGAWVEPGYLLFLRGTALMAQRLELDPTRLTGEPVLVADGLPVNPVPGSAPFTAAGSTILYRSGGRAPGTRLVWFDRSGKRLAEVGPEAADISVSLSPDGTRAAVARVNDPSQPLGGEPTVNIWVVDLARGIPTRVTFDPANGDENPTWSPDGRRLAFATHVKGARADIFIKDASGSGTPEPLLSGGRNAHPISWSADGRFLLLQSVNDAGRVGLSSLSLAGGRNVRPYLEGDFDQAQGQFSPDGRFVAYVSNESGRAEVYVRAFPEGEERWQVSSSGGASPRWRRDSRELFYVAPDGAITAVEVSLAPRFAASPPRALFTTTIRPVNFNFYGGAAPYDVSRDGSRFLVDTVETPGTVAPLRVILNWQPPR